MKWTKKQTTTIYFQSLAMKWTENRANNSSERSSFLSQSKHGIDSHEATLHFGPVKDHNPAYLLQSTLKHGGENDLKTARLQLPQTFLKVHWCDATELLLWYAQLFGLALSTIKIQRHQWVSKTKLSR